MVQIRRAAWRALLVATCWAAAPTAALAAATPAPGETPPSPGAAIYQSRCAMCHEGGVPKAPAKLFLQMMATDAIHGALTVGVMQAQAAGLSDADKVAVAEYLSGQSLADSRSKGAAEAAAHANRCGPAHAAFDLTRPPAKAGWGIDRQNRRFVPGEIAGLAAADLPKLELKWAFGYPRAQRARSQPLVALGAVYVGSQDGTVYALDFDTGCTRWTFRASAEVRTAIQMDGWQDGKAPARPLIYFGDLMARVYAVDALTGELVWRVKVDDHPNATVTAAPVLHDGRLYVAVSSLEVATAVDPKYACCTFRGSIHALDARTGATAWQTYTIPEPPKPVGKTSVGTQILGPSGAPIWNTPVLDTKRGVLYAGTGENYSSPADDRSDALLAFRLTDGKLLWARQKTAGDAWNAACMMPGHPNCPKEDGPDVDFGAATILTTLPDGRDVLLAGQKSGDVYAVKPEDGSIVWHRKVGRGGIQGGVHFGMALDGTTLYVPISDMTGEEAEGTNKLPGEPRAGMHAVDAATGEIRWSTLADNRCAGQKYCEPGISAAITAIPGAVIAGHMDGRLRAYAQDTGRVLWEYDTHKPFATVNGVEAGGGSMGGGAGAVVQDGHLLVNSGYGLYFHMPGNVLLMFGKGD